jgi:hypothetical protein
MTDVGAELPYVCPVEHMDEWLEVAAQSQAYQLAV